MKYRIPKHSLVARAVVDLRPFVETSSWRNAKWYAVRTVREVVYAEKDLYHCDRKYYYFFLPDRAHPYTILEVHVDDVQVVS